MTGALFPPTIYRVQFDLPDTSVQRYFAELRMGLSDGTFVTLQVHPDPEVTATNMSRTAHAIRLHMQGVRFR